MKNSSHTLKQIVSLAIFTSALTFTAHTMDGTLDITGVDQHELIKALYEHATENGNTRESNPQASASPSLSSRAFSFALDLATRANILSAQRYAYNAELRNFVMRYQLDLHKGTNSSCVYIHNYDEEYGTGTAKSIYDQLAIETKRLADATELLERLQMDEQKSRTNIHAEKKEDDNDGLETIYFYKTFHPEEEK